MREQQQIERDKESDAQSDGESQLHLQTDKGRDRE